MGGQAINGPPPAPPPPAIVTSFFDLPTLANERSFYDNIGWARTASDETFVFSSDPGVLTSSIDVHNDTESDDLWNWRQQQARGYGTPTSTWVSRWSTYFKNVYLGTIQPGSIEHTSGEWDHIYGPGLVLQYVKDGDAAALTAAEAIADFVVAQRGTPITNNNSTGYGGGRDIARWGLLFSYLAEATGKEKWALWRDRVLADYMTGTGSTWAEAPSLGIVQGGHYFVDRNTYASAGNWNNTGTTTNYDAGRRVGSTWMMAMHAEFIIRCFMQTGRADLRDRIIKMAYFNLYYAWDPTQTSNGGPFTGAYYGVEAGGGRYHRDNGGPATYDCSPINSLVWGYKLTGDPALLAQAKLHMRKGTLYAEGTPPGAALGSSTDVHHFIDVQREHPSISSDIAFGYNKGQLQHCYQIFENGGAPSIYTAGVPAAIANLQPGYAADSGASASAAFTSFSVRDSAASSLGIFAFSGAYYDTKRFRYCLSGGGHNADNGNGHIGLPIYNVSSFVWEVVRAHSPNTQTVNSSAVETYSDGAPASAHTYRMMQYDPVSDECLLFGVAATYALGGGSFTGLRRLQFSTTPPTWVALSGSLRKASIGNGSAHTAYDNLQKCIWSKDGAISSTNARLERYDCVTHTLSERNDGLGTMNIDVAMEVDPNRRYMIAIGGFYSVGPMDAGNADMVVWDLATDNGSTVQSTVRATGSMAGFPSALRQPKLGLCFHPPSGTFLAWGPNGGNTLYRLIPPATNPRTGTWTFTTFTASGATLPSCVSGNSFGGIYNKLQWAPYPNDHTDGVFIMDMIRGSESSKTTGNTVFFKPNFNSVAQKIYQTSFDLTETKVSEGARWIRSTPEGGASVHSGWHDVSTTGGNAVPRFNAGPGDPNYDDCYAYLSGTWYLDMESESTIYNAAASSPREVELLFRCNDTSTTVSTYECLFAIGGGAAIVRWNGAPGDFTYLIVDGDPGFTGPSGGLSDGDRIRARCSGTAGTVTLQMWYARAATPTTWVSIGSVTDTSPSRLLTGSPGVGFFNRTGLPLNYGIKDFKTRAV